MAPSAMSLTPDQLDQLEGFLKDWLRHSGRTQSDLRRSLRAHSIRMPVLLQELQRTELQGGLPALAERLCGIEALWHQGGADRLGPGAPELDEQTQLDLLLQAIRDDVA
jgi:hypothetical protein